MSMQQTLRALADPTRRESFKIYSVWIKSLIFSVPAQAGGAAVSRHLSILREAGLIRDERDGKYIYYELNASVLEEIMLWLTELQGGRNHD